MWKIFFILFLINYCKLSALPSDQTYCERAVDGLRWHQKHSFCNYLTEKRLQEILPIVKEIIDLERSYYDDYYQVIVGQNSNFIAYQVLLKELYKITRKQEFSNFEFLRPLNHPSLETNLEQFFVNHPDLLRLEEFQQFYKDYPELTQLRVIDEEYQRAWESIPYEKRKIFTEVKLDNTPDIAFQLVSGSLTLETMAPMDSALDVFARGKGMAFDDEMTDQICQLIVQAARFEGVDDPELESKLAKLVALSPQSQEGILMQVFIPKKQAQSVMYIAWGGGFLNKKATENIQKYFAEMEQSRESTDFNMHKPDQVRLLAGAISPDSVIIKRHTLVDPEKLLRYKDSCASFWEELVKEKTE